MNNELGIYIGVDKTNKNPIILETYKKREKENVLSLGVLGKGHGFTVTQSLENIRKSYPIHCRSIEHIYKSNNWLKLHGMTKRRKPFKKEYIILDEFQMMFHN